MALITCSECNKEISDKSTACVGCGAPRLLDAPVSTENHAPTPETKPVNLEAVGFIMILAAFGIGASSLPEGTGMFFGVLGFIIFIAGRFQK